MLIDCNIHTAPRHTDAPADGRGDRWLRGCHSVGESESVYHLGSALIENLTTVKAFVYLQDELQTLVSSVISRTVAIATDQPEKAHTTCVKRRATALALLKPIYAEFAVECLSQL